MSVHPAPSSGSGVAGVQSGLGLGSLPRRQVIGTLVAMGLSLLLAALDQTIVGTAMPRIVAELQGFEQYAWVTTAYLLASTTVVPIVGKLSDLYGRKPFSLIGITVFIVSFVVIDRVTPYTLWKEIIDEHNTALAILIGAIAIGLSIIIAAAIV